MTTNQAYLGTNQTNPFHYQAFNLCEPFINRNGLTIVGTPISKTQCKWTYFNTIEALGFPQKGTGHGIPLGDYDNHFIMSFDLTSTQQVSHDFIHPELTNCFEIFTFVQNCHHLKHNFLGVFAADIFFKLKTASFLIVKSSKLSESGTHWLLLCRRRN